MKSYVLEVALLVDLSAEGRCRRRVSRHKLNTLIACMADVHSVPLAVIAEHCHRANAQLRRQ